MPPKFYFTNAWAQTLVTGFATPNASVDIEVTDGDGDTVEVLQDFDIDDRDGITNDLDIGDDDTLTLSLNDVRDLSESSNQLIISGDVGDTVNLTGGLPDSDDNQTIDGEVFDVFTFGNATVLIEQAVQPVI